MDAVLSQIQTPSPVLFPFLMAAGWRSPTAGKADPAAAEADLTGGEPESAGVRYKLAYSSNFSSILEPIIENNYQLFMVERQMMRGAKTFVKTMKEFANDLTLCDDPKKNTKVWQKPVYTDD